MLDTAHPFLHLTFLRRKLKNFLKEHSGNKIITNFESEVGPGVIQFCTNSKQQGEN